MRILNKLSARWKAHQDRRYMRQIEHEAQRQKDEGGFDMPNRSARRSMINSTRGRGRARGVLHLGRRRIGSRGGDPQMRRMRKSTSLRRSLREREPNSNRDGRWEYR
jgi:hypothetical protein